MLSEEVRGVLRAVDLPKPELLPAQSLLDPETVALQVPQFAQTLSGCRAHGCRTVRPHSKWEVKSCIPPQGLLAKTNTSATHHAVVFRLAAAEIYAGLRR